jgi:hypothetical protein
MRKYRSVKLVKKQRRVQRLKIMAVVFVIILSIFLLSLASKVEGFKIKYIEITGNDTLSTQEVEEMILKDLKGNYLKLFSRANILIYPKDRIYNDLKDNFKRIKEVEIKFDDLESIRVNIKEREPQAVWCREEEDCYFLDNTGYIFDKAPLFSGNVYFKYYGNLEEDKKTILGKMFLNEDQFEKNSWLLNKLEDDNLSLKQLVVLENGDYEIWFAGEGKIIFNPSQDFEELLENIQTILNSEELQGKKFEYIDLRFGNRIFYKSLFGNEKLLGKIR